MENGEKVGNRVTKILNCKKFYQLKKGVTLLPQSGDFRKIPLKTLPLLLLCYPYKINSIKALGMIGNKVTSFLY